MRKKQDPISLPKRIVLGASLILASTYTVAWAGNTQNETPHHHAIESITQVKTVTGVVTDQYGPVIGANVHVKGSTTGTITDIDGKFSIEVPVNSVLEISYIGFLTEEIQITGTTKNLNIHLKEDSETLEEVVVVGYGTQKKVNMSGSVFFCKCRRTDRKPSHYQCITSFGRCSSRCERYERQQPTR